jgi:8-oxo-dGTP pyrophosphatase MutT (NUDIX family)
MRKGGSNIGSAMKIYSAQEFRSKAITSAVPLAAAAPPPGSRAIDRCVTTDQAPRLRHAAVLVPVVDRGACATVLLTRRAEHLPNHAGQIAFPGGKIEPGDASPVAAAIREAHEEIGLSPHHVEPVGLLDGFETGTGFHVVPVLSVVYDCGGLTPNEREVCEIFEVPLDFLMTEDNHQRHRAVWRGAEREYYAIPYGDRFMWGATARILRDIYERFYR